jgi:hypothetical protein
MISTLWVSHLPEDKRDAFKQLILNSNRDPVLGRLLELVETKRESLEASERSAKIYDNPSWAFLQAHNNGMRQALQLIEDLLSFIKE